MLPFVICNNGWQRWSNLSQFENCIFMMNADSFFINRLNADENDFIASLMRLRQPPDGEDVHDVVAAIIRRVREEGDAALVELSAKFDGNTASQAAELFISPAELQAACSKIQPEIMKEIENAAARVRNYHQQQKTESWQSTDAHGNICGERVAAVSRAAVYAPGGQAAYPSSALMGLIPAKVAGVSEVFLMTPAAKGSVPPITLAAAATAGADGVWMLGGAQAVAAAAFGTETVARADVIVGPGNVYVAEAKRQLCGQIGIDSLAGPSEVLIVCDETANPDWVAADMLAQAEHDRHAQSIAISPNASFLDEVAAAMATQIQQQPRADIIAQSLASRGALITAKDMVACCQIANEIAAEHVQVMCADAVNVASQIHHAGGIFIGEYSCVPLGDYGAGPNHVLPTAQTARFASPLGVEHFLKRTGILHINANGAPPVVKTAVALAKAEGLFAHASSAMLRDKK